MKRICSKAERRGSLLVVWLAAFSGTGGAVFGAEIRSLSYKESVLPSVQVLEADEGKGGASTSNSELLDGAAS